MQNLASYVLYNRAFISNHIASLSLQLATALALYTQSSPKTQAPEKFRIKILLLTLKQQCSSSMQKPNKRPAHLEFVVWSNF